jgi:flavin reductase ActVB
MTVDRRIFREAMTRFPTGVTIVTTVDGDNRRWGFTASAFTLLSLEPPRVLVCLDRSASCYPHFCAAGRFAVNVLAADQEPLARRFATKGIDKFAGLAFQPGQFRLPLLADAVTSLECQKSDLLPGGDHVILVGEPLSIRLGKGTPAVLFHQRFWRFPQAAASVPTGGADDGHHANPGTHLDSIVSVDRQ